MKLIAPSKIDEYLNMPGGRLIDIRSEAAYRRMHIRNAENIPYETFWEQFHGTRRECLILYCDRGNQSLVLCQKLEEKGFTACSVNGGIRACRGRKLVRGR